MVWKHQDKDEQCHGFVKLASMIDVSHDENNCYNAYESIISIMILSF